jgi:hypothetical protein
MIKTERYLVAFAIVSLTFNIAGITGAAFLMMISLLILSLFYYIFSFALLNGISFSNIFRRSTYKAISGLRLAGTVATGMALAPICTGILYCALHLNGGEIIILTGIVSGMFVGIVAAIRYRKSKSKFYTDIFIRLGIFTIAGILAIVFAN